MWPDRISNPRPQAYESGALPTTLRGPARRKLKLVTVYDVIGKEIFVSHSKGNKIRDLEKVELFLFIIIHYQCY